MWQDKIIKLPFPSSTLTQNYVVTYVLAQICWSLKCLTCEYVAPLRAPRWRNLKRALRSNRITRAVYAFVWMRQVYHFDLIESYNGWGWYLFILTSKITCLCLSLPPPLNSHTRPKDVFAGGFNTKLLLLPRSQRERTIEQRGFAGLTLPGFRIWRKALT